jgi:hypothetical protein
MNNNPQLALPIVYMTGLHTTYKNKYKQVSEPCILSKTLAHIVQQTHGFRELLSVIHHPAKPSNKNHRMPAMASLYMQQHSILTGSAGSASLLALMKVLSVSFNIRDALIQTQGASPTGQYPCLLHPSSGRALGRQLRSSPRATSTVYTTAGRSGCSCAAVRCRAAVQGCSAPSDSPAVFELLQKGLCKLKGNRMFKPRQKGQIANKAVVRRREG